MYTKVNGRKQKDGFKTSSFTPENVYVACVAVKISDNDVQVRDTKDSGNTTLTFTHREWSAFIQGVKANEFEL